jgi:hypothetical protein
LASGGGSDVVLSGDVKGDTVTVARITMPAAKK